MAILGFNGQGANQFNIVRWWACKFTATEAGTFTDLNLYFDMTGPGNYKLCIWADSISTPGTPGALLFQSTPDTHTTTLVWKSRPCNYSFVSGEVLHLGAIADDWMNIYSDAGVTNQLTEFTQDYTGWPTVPNPPTVQQQYNSKTSIYGNYTPSSVSTIKGIATLKGIQTLKF